MEIKAKSYPAFQDRNKHSFENWEISAFRGENGNLYVNCMKTPHYRSNIAS
jgi:hypothetical protein